MKRTDRRVERTRELLQKALIGLIGERGYESITVQDIVDRANVGRTTFYKHYNGKEDLFIICHEAFVREFRPGPLYSHPLSREELLSPEAPPGMFLAYKHLKESWARLHPIFQGRDGPLIMRQIRDRSAKEIETNLRIAFADANSTIPLNVLANYLAGAQMALLQWLLEKRRSLTPEILAQTLQRLQRAAICEAFSLPTRW